MKDAEDLQTDLFGGQLDMFVKPEPTDIDGWQEPDSLGPLTDNCALDDIAKLGIFDEFSMLPNVEKSKSALEEAITNTSIVSTVASTTAPQNCLYPSSTTTVNRHRNIQLHSQLREHLEAAEAKHLPIIPISNVQTLGQNILPTTPVSLLNDRSKIQLVRPLQKTQPTSITTITNPITATTPTTQHVKLESPHSKFYVQTSIIPTSSVSQPNVVQTSTVQATVQATAQPIIITSPQTSSANQISSLQVSFMVTYFSIFY